MPTDLKVNLLSQSRDEIKQVLCNNIYGSLPTTPVHLTVDIVREDIGFAAGKATLCHKNLVLDMGERYVQIPFTEMIPNDKANCPAIVYLGYESAVPNKFLPAEEIIDRGYAIFLFNHEDVSTNDSNFKSGIYNDVAPSRRKKNAPGKLMLWAWTAIRLMEYVASLDIIDKNSIAVAGHGLLGKAALLAGAFDERFNYIIANDTISFGTGSELDYGKLSLIMPHLFCPAFTDNVFPECEHSMLLSLCSPRSVLVGSCADDPRSLPQEEYESLKSAFSLSEGESKIPTERGCIQTENVSYHVRGGMHYLSREDWKIYLDFIDKKRK